MERKTVHALLLSLAVVAGGVMMTTDAHAQTNTERLMTTVDNTNSILAALQSLADAVADGFASVLAAIGMVQTSVDDMSGHLEHLEGDVAGISSDVASVDSSVAAVSSDVASIADDVADVSSSLQSVQNDLAGLSAGLAGSTAAFSSISEQVSANQVAINDLSAKLDMISEAVGAVQETVEAEPEADADTQVGSTLSAVDEDFPVLVSAFSQNRATASTYKTSLTFSCEEHVFVNTVNVDDASDPFVGEAGDATTVSMTIDGFTIYTNKFFATGTTAAVFDQGADLKLRPLSAGSELTLDISTDEKTVDLRTSNTTHPNHLFTLEDYLNVERSTTRLDTDGDTVDDNDLTKTDAGKIEVLTISVEWYTSAADAKCTLKSPASPAVDYTETDETVSSVLIAMAEETGTIKTIVPEDITCSDETAITKVSLEGLLDGFNSFVALKIDADGSKSLKFDADYTATLDEPLEFSGGNVTLTGKIPASAAVLTLTYDTVADGSCTNND